MSLPVPTTQEVSDLAIGQLQSSLGQTIPFLPKSFIRVLAKVFAGITVLLYKYCGFIFLQLFVAYATDETTTINGKSLRPLVEWGRLIGVGDPTPSVQAEFRVTLPVHTQTGSLPGGKSLVRAQTGVVYQTVSEVLLNAPTVTVTIRASSDQLGGDGSGVIGNLQIGDIVEFSSPPPNVGSKATVASQTVQGADAESADTYRARVLKRFQRVPQGGAYADYDEWALEVPGIVNVYPYAGAPGQVDVYCEADEIVSGSPDGFPTPALLDAVAVSIAMDEAGLATRRPVGAAVNVLSITRLGFAVTVTGLDPPNQSTKDAIAEGVDEYLRAGEPFIEGLSILPRKDRITEAAISGIVDGIVDAAGASVVSVRVNPGPAYILGRGEKAKLLGLPTFS